MLRWSRIVVLFAALSAGCSGAPPSPGAPDLSHAAPDLGPDLASPPPDLELPSRDPTNHPPLPMMSKHGGPVLKAMAIWTVVWPGEEQLGARTERFHAWMLRSDYWTQSMAQYGVGAGVSKGLIVLPDPAPAQMDVGVFEGLTAALAKQHPVDANTVFAFVVPLTTQVTGGGGAGCFSYGGYHTQTSGGVPYEVNLQCGGLGTGGFDDLTFVLSHEAAEAATDPRPFSNPGWFSDDYSILGEIGDLCNPLGENLTSGNPPLDGGVADDLYYVARLWSNKNASLGDVDPCVPAPPGAIYFNVGVEPNTGTVTVDKQGRAALQIKFEPYSYGDVGAIHWQVAQGIPGVNILPNHGSAHAGDTIPGTITVTPLAQSGTYIFSLSSTAAKTGGNQQWFGTLTIQ